MFGCLGKRQAFEAPLPSVDEAKYSGEWAQIFQRKVSTWLATCIPHATIKTVRTCGRNAKAGTAFIAATIQGYGGSGYVFFINEDGHLTQSNRDSDGRWHENQAIKMRDLD
ncbi:hypothetical protein FS837_007257 [Tulasnella sp. UAMH 9824]|nr:hypothetical protein FS837_007257 [Tulasnella sp. UAMH 9824]